MFTARFYFVNNIVNVGILYPLLENKVLNFTKACCAFWYYSVGVGFCPKIEQADDS